DRKRGIAHRTERSHEAPVVGPYAVETRRRTYRNEARNGLARAEIGDVLVERQIGQAVSVVGEELRLVLEITPYTSQPLTNVRMQPGVDERDAPFVEIRAFELDLLAALRQCKIVRHAFVVIEEVFADQIAPISQTQDELLVAKVRVIAHQVPEYGSAANRHERLGNRVGMLTQARSQTTA